MSGAGTGAVVGAVLVGGRSRRMGAPKHLVRLADGRAMGEVVGAVLAQVCAEVILVGAPVGDAAAPSIPDCRSGCGPLGGIEALLRSGRAERYLVVPCDMPRLTAGLLRRLVEAPPAPFVCFAGNSAVVETPASLHDRRQPGALRPLPARIDAALAATVTARLDAGDGAVRTLARVPGALTLPLVDEEAALLANVNTPRELDALG